MCRFVDADSKQQDHNLKKDDDRISQHCSESSILPCGQAVFVLVEFSFRCRNRNSLNTRFVEGPGDCVGASSRGYQMEVEVAREGGTARHSVELPGGLHLAILAGNGAVSDGEAA